MDMTCDDAVQCASHPRVPDEVTEVLEAMWTMQERGLTSLDDLSRHAATRIDAGLLERLRSEKLLELEQGRVGLLPRGRDMAEKIIRRHRLAERLICDVMGSAVEESEDAACEFEHLVAERLTTSICTLLGHPRFCPHNRAIPEGDCCRQAREQVAPIVVSSDLLEVGDTARIAYVATRDHSLMTRLSAMGVAPGLALKLLQKRPSYVVRCEETEIALEKEVARSIYVWRQ